MNTMMGACRYCGQNQMINATDSEDADRRATALCKCEGAERARFKRSVDGMLRNLFCDPDGGDDELYRMPDDMTMDLIRKICYEIVAGSRVGCTKIQIPYLRLITINGYADRVEIELKKIRIRTYNSKDYYTYSPEETDREDG